MRRVGSSPTSRTKDRPHSANIRNIQADRLAFERQNMSPLLLIILLLILLVLGGFGLAVKGLIVLFWIAVILLIVELVYYLAAGRRSRL